MRLSGEKLNAARCLPAKSGTMNLTGNVGSFVTSLALRTCSSGPRRHRRFLSWGRRSTQVPRFSGWERSRAADSGRMRGGDRYSSAARILPAKAGSHIPDGVSARLKRVEGLDT